VELVELTGVLGLALALGALHAFDADHVMAVTALASGRAEPRELLAVSARWALGHGAALMALGSLVLLLGMAIPASLSRAAELAVGVLLLLIGAWVLYDLHGRRLHVHVHHHDGLPPHAHWHSHNHGTHHRHRHSATLVGLVHGIAGSAPVLALLPLGQSSVATLAAGERWLVGLAYLLLFSLGVLVAMAGAGGALSLLYRRLGPARLVGVKSLVGVLAMACGGYWLAAALA